MWIYILIAVLAVIAAVALVIWHDTHNFVVREYTVPTDKIQGQKTFVLLSDLHGYTYGRDNEKLISAIDEVHPDIILCAGDMFTASKLTSDFRKEPGFKLLSSLAQKYPVYASNGNHEMKIKDSTRAFGNLFDRYRQSLKREGIVYLENESVELTDDNIRISGLDLELDYFQKVIKKKMEPGLISEKLGPLGSEQSDKLQILIAHNPQYFPEYSDWGADITVSGHVHGGIVRLPLLGGVISPAIALFPKYDGGKFTRNGKAMILSRGLGTHTIHVRFLNPGEVSVIRVLGGN